MNSKKSGFLLLGLILILLGVAVYLTIGGQVRLIALAAVGIVLLIVGMVHPIRAKLMTTAGPN